MPLPLQLHMKPLYVAFLWHMHQPIYKDPASGRYCLPWVRLHALKGYTDIPAITERYPNFKSTLNFTSSLLVQLEDYLDHPEVGDDFLAISLIPADQLKPEDKQFILKNFFMNNLEHVIRPHSRYNELFHKRGTQFLAEELPNYLKRFTTEDFLDLQVLFNLMWFGFSAKNQYPRLRSLIEKARGFSEEEKKEVLEIQRQVMKEVIPRLKRLREKKNLELTCSPFYHPILPLLAKQDQVDLGYAWPEDAIWQVREGLATFERLLGAKPKGMWPSEGSVSAGAISVMRGEGVQWIATDEEILLNSLTDPRREHEIYEPFQFQSHPFHIFFRDKELSDCVGFRYHQMPHDEAVRDLVQRLHQIQESVASLEGDHVVSIILGGENPWEFYPEGGEFFLSRLAEALSADSRLKTVTFSDYLESHPVKKSLPSIHPGSWINHNFNIWFHHEEDLRAWQYLEKTREALKQAEAGLTPKVRAEAWREIYIAEASDWNWWYGDEFYTESSEVFDHLFRGHLARVYELIGTRSPAFLKNPIKNFLRPTAEREPAGLISPVIDGKVTHFYEWAEAGYFCASRGGAMYQTSTLIDGIYYGFDKNNFYLRLDLSYETLGGDPAGSQICLHLHAQHDLDLCFKARNPSGYEITGAGAGRGRISGDSILEIQIPFSDLKLSPGDSFSFSMAFYRDHIKQEEWPRHGLIELKVPNQDYESHMWSV